MIKHIDIGSTSPERKNGVARLIRAGKIKFGGYVKGKIYGTLSCKSGKRMKLENRIFFESEKEAVELGYRPCGHCLPEKYKAWKEVKLKSNLFLLPFYI